MASAHQDTGLLKAASTKLGSLYALAQGRSQDVDWKPLLVLAVVVPLATVSAWWTFSYLTSPLRRYPGPFLAGEYPPTPPFPHSPLVLGGGADLALAHYKTKAGQTSGDLLSFAAASTMSSSRSCTNGTGPFCASGPTCSTWTCLR